MHKKISFSFWVASFFLLTGLFTFWGNFFQEGIVATGTANKVAFQTEKRFPVVTIPKEVVNPQIVTPKNTVSTQATKPASIRQTKTS
ncbi:MAG: hypothetical protein PHH40_04295 [Candidatus Moranbacteria bacterium]|nr:hypothetical protein [Candidatus Moranbacteria bacterium]MDD3964542.1 hypothetical protein [Candidatus Moranbacteria bacterium]